MELLNVIKRDLKAQNRGCTCGKTPVDTHALSELVACFEWLRASMNGYGPNLWNKDDMEQVVVHPGRILVSRSRYDLVGSEIIRILSGCNNAELLVVDDDKFEAMSHAEKTTKLHQECCCCCFDTK